MRIHKILVFILENVKGSSESQFLETSKCSESLELDCSQNLKRCQEWLQVVDKYMNETGENPTDVQIIDFCLQKTIKVCWNKFFRNFTAYRQKSYWSPVWYYLFTILLVDWNNPCSFLLGSKCTSSRWFLNYQSKWMSDRVSAKFNHYKRNIIMVMCLIYIQGSYYFNNFWFTKRYSVNAFLRHVSKFTRQDTVNWN